MIRNVLSLARNLIYRLAGRYVHRIVRGLSIVYNPHISGKLIPFDRQDALRGESQIVIGHPTTVLTTDADGVPVPPQDLREGWTGPDASYLDSGRRDMATMLALLQDTGESPSNLRRVLDFGCAAGRTLRFYPSSDADECWGVDIKARHIAWCQQHLSPPFLFATTTTFPHLPFEDGYFDLVYCNSVFTHIGELADATLLELRRILRPDGSAYVTVHDDSSIDTLFHQYPERGLTDMLRRVGQETRLFGSGYRFFFTGTEPWTQTFYQSDYLVKKWSGFMDVVSVTPGAMDYQTALILRKRRG